VFTTLFLPYLLRCIPSLVLGGGLLTLLPRRYAEFRILIYIMLFIVIRDTMTPSGLWSLGSQGGFWLRVVTDPVILLVSGASAVGFVLLTNKLEPELGRLLVWRMGPWARCIAGGTAGALVVALPLWAMYCFTPLHARGGAVPMHLLPMLLVFCLAANFYEESLFRGYFQGYMQKRVSPLRAAFLSGVLFSFGHIFLATSVTNVGASVLLFTLYEGIVSGLVRSRWGLIASSITHGGGIFLLCSGLV
jgi:membrane protease YdiL (CAAX protease family)